MNRVLVSTAGIGDNVEVALVRLCHNEVINNPTFLISEEGQCALGGEARKEMKETEKRTLWTSCLC